MNLPEPNFNPTRPFEAVRTWAKSENIADLTVNERLTEIERLSPVALAYVGDAVYELYFRTHFLLPPKRMADYHGQVIAQVRAEAQAARLEMLQPYLTAAEREILRRGRNACGAKPKRLSLQIYQRATSLEALIGYLYLTDLQRLEELFAKLELK